MRSHIIISWLFSESEKKDSNVSIPSPSDIIYCSSLSLICTSIFCLNVTVIILYVLKKNLQKGLPNSMLCHSSIVGTFNGVTFNVVLLLSFNKIVSTTYLEMLHLLSVYAIFLTVTSLLCMVLERYVAITKPGFYKRVMGRCSMKVFAVLLWTLATVILSIYYIGNYYIVVFTLLVLIECFLIVTLLHRTFTAVRVIIRKKVEEARMVRNLNNIYFIKRNQERDRRFFKILVGMVIMFILCFLPWAMAILTDKFFPNFRQNATFKIVCRFSVIFYLCSAVVNPILTLALKDDYKNVFTKFWRGSKNRRMEQDQRPPSTISTSV